VIPHAPGWFAAALAARALVVPVIEATFQTVAMAAPRAAEAVAAGEAGAGRSAVDVAAVAGAADRKNRLTAGARGQAARRALSHRLPRTAVAARRLGKRAKTCDNPDGRAFGRATTTDLVH
jgi:hypothetical protein